MSMLCWEIPCCTQIKQMQLPVIPCCNKSENITNVTVADAVKIQIIHASLRCCYMSVPQVNKSWKDFEPPARLTEPEGLITRRKMLEGRPTNALSCYSLQWSWAGGDLFLMQPNSSSLYTQSQRYTYKRRLWYKRCFVKHSPLCAPQSKEEDLFSISSGLWSFCFRTQH